MTVTRHHTTRPVLKCRCGGLYRDPDAHHDAFGHRPDPVYADLAHRPDPMFDPLRYRPEPAHDAFGPQPGRAAA